jgi:hypothetical protein
VNQDRDRALLELTQRSPFWVCLLVFALLAADTGFRLASSVALRKQLDEAQLMQAQNVGRMSSTLAQLPQIEANLRALSLDLFQVAKTNATAAQIVREFNIQWTPPAESFLTPPAIPPVIPAPETPTPAAVSPATNAPAAK